MEFKLFVGNLAKSTTEDDLQTLFRLAGEIISLELYRNRKTGESNGFAFITMSARSEADRAVSMFNTFLLDNHSLKVNLVQARESHTRRFSRLEP